MIEKTTIYIPLGTNCSTAFILQKMGLRQFSLPFDWVDTPIKGIHNALLDLLTAHSFNINELEETVAKFVDHYFANMVGQTNSKYGIWHPHDIYANDEELNTIKQKYARRFKRLINVLTNSKYIVFLTAAPVCSKQTQEEYMACLTYLKSVLQATFSAVSINMVFGNENNELNKYHLCYNIPTNGCETGEKRGIFEDRCVEILKNNDIFTQLT